MGAPACQAPRPGADGEVGTVEEIGEMMAEGDVEPVVGEVEEGQTAGIVTDPHALADPATVDYDPEEDEPAFEESPYILFGERIVVREFEDSLTFITKPYTLPVGVQPATRQALIDQPEFEIPRPSFVTVIGFIGSWAMVGLMLAFVYWIFTLDT